MSGMLSAGVIPRTKGVIAGFGEIERGNLDPIIAHTITFGTGPADLFDPSCSRSCSVTLDSDGAPRATITGPDENVHSGFIFAVLEGYTGGLPVPQLPSSLRRASVSPFRRQERTITSIPCTITLAWSAGDCAATTAEVGRRTLRSPALLVSRNANYGSYQFRPVGCVEFFKQR